MFASKTIAAGVLALGTLLAAAPANADSFSFSIQSGHPGSYYSHGPQGGNHWNAPRPHQTRSLSPKRVRQILRSRGYREIQFVDRRGSVYQARAEDHRGRDFRLVVSARNGAILERQRVRR